MVVLDRAILLERIVMGEGLIVRCDEVDVVMIIRKSHYFFVVLTDIIHPVIGGSIYTIHMIVQVVDLQNNLLMKNSI